MNLEIRQMSQVEAEQIASWRYDGPYAFYDADADADDLALLLSGEVRENRYFSACSEDGSLIGFFEFKREGSTIELGLGLRPDRTGKGSGLAFIEAGLAFARDRFQPERFKLAVATFNERAITVYERAGFVAVRTYDHETAGSVHRFLEMQQPADDQRRLRTRASRPAVTSRKPAIAAPSVPPSRPLPVIGKGPTGGSSSGFPAPRPSAPRRPASCCQP